MAGLAVSPAVPAAAGEPQAGERLAPVRQELGLHPGPRAPDGAPSWTLHDPAVNRYYRIGWLEFEILARWHLEEPAAIAAAVTAETTLAVGVDDVERVARFLAAGNLLQARGPAALDRLRRQAAARRPHWAGWLLKNYLFVRIPLVRPDRFLAAALPWVSWAFGGGFLAAVLLAGLLGGWLALRQWDVFVHSFLEFLSWDGALLIGGALAVTKVCHELGHALTARRYGCRVPTMGVALLVLWPVLYTDTTDAWRLVARRPRLAIGAAGMAAELALGAVALLAWSLLAPGPLRSAVFLLATTAWAMTLMVNLNPFMRFDGYFLLSDLLDVANLQDRAFALGRWWLREALFGFGEPVPEPLPPRRRRLLIAYALATWLYRFGLFLGIALLVYHVFFKALGVVLFAVEIGWFLVRPIVRELAEWARRRRQLRLNRRSAATFAALAGLVGLALVPWRGTVSAPALLRAGQQATLYAPSAARLDTILVRPGDRVAAGAALFRLVSPDLDHNLDQTRRRVELLRGQVALQGLGGAALERGQVTWRELEAALAEHQGHAAEAARLVVTAPFAGRVVDLAAPLAVGEWLKAGEPLATLVGTEGSVVEAYVTEADLGRLAVGAAGRFLAEGGEGEAVPGRVAALDDASTRALPEPDLASVHAGPIAVRPDTGGQLIPEESLYRVRITPDPPAAVPVRVTRGTVHLDGERRSLAGRVWQAVLAVLVRESGL